MNRKFFSFFLGSLLLGNVFCSDVLSSSAAASAAKTQSILTLDPQVDREVKILAAYCMGSHDQAALYQKLLVIRNGKAVSGFGAKDLATLLTLRVELERITSAEGNLDHRALLNRANADVALGDFTEVDVEKRLFYQEAYYSYTLLAAKTDMPAIKIAAEKNAATMIQDGKINVRQAHETSPAVVTPPEEEAVAVALAVRDAMKEVNSAIGLNDLLASLPGSMIGAFLKTKEPMTAEKEAEMRRGLDRIRGKAAEQFQALQSVIEGMVVGKVMDDMSTQGPAELEAIEAATAAARGSAPIISLEDYHFRAMGNMLNKLYALVGQTPVLRGRIPVIVPVGRSVSWLVRLHDLWKPQLQTGIDLRHILASGLRRHEPTDPQKRAYKGYLDSKGFNRITETHEVIFLDVLESGRTLRTMQDLFEKLYPELKGHIQHIAIVYDEKTADLPCARTFEMDQFLRPVLFAKHSEKSCYCPDSVYYPHDWDKPGFLEDFKEPEGATAWYARLKEWVESDGGVQFRDGIAAQQKALEMPEDDLEQ